MDLDVQRVEDPGSKLLELFSLFYNLTYIGLFAYVFCQTGTLHTLSKSSARTLAISSPKWRALTAQLSLAQPLHCVLPSSMKVSHIQCWLFVYCIWCHGADLVWGIFGTWYLHKFYNVYGCAKDHGKKEQPLKLIGEKYWLLHLITV